MSYNLEDSKIQTNINKKWVSDEIGDEYKDWKLSYSPNGSINNTYFIKASTGTGKTYFILNNLLKHIIDVDSRSSILYLQS